MKEMCPHCGKLLAPTKGLTRCHADADTGVRCEGSWQNPRNPESDGRPLWNGKPNPHFYRNQPGGTR